MQRHEDDHVEYPEPVLSPMGGDDGGGLTDNDQIPPTPPPSPTPTPTPTPK